MKNNNLSYIEDQAIIYNEKLLEVKEIINDLEELELDTKVIKDDIKAIEESVSQHVVNNYNLNNPQSECSNSIMQTATSMDYSKAINQLEEIIRLIKDEWKDYYLITQKCHEIKSCLADIENMDFNQIIDKTVLERGKFPVNCLYKETKFLDKSENTDTRYRPSFFIISLFLSKILDILNLFSKKHSSKYLFIVLKISEKSVCSEI